MQNNFFDIKGLKESYWSTKAWDMAWTCMMNYRASLFFQIPFLFAEQKELLHG